MNSIVYNEDCIKAMKNYNNKHFELAIVDPPYGLDKRLCTGGGKLKNRKMAKLYKNKNWDVLPPKEYWENLFRISKNQIIFGANYFFDFLPSTRGIICWDKLQYLHTLSQFELIWTSFDKPAKIIRKSNNDKHKIHPTQKSVNIYKYLFEYAKIEKNQKIIDTHIGSGSSRIAAYDYKLDFTGFELDQEYYKSQEKRFKNHKSQIQINF